MKKEYISPDIKVSVIDAVMLSATSGTIQANTNEVEVVDDGEELGAKKSNFDIWADE